MSDHRIENKRITVDDFLEEYSQEWIRRAETEKEYLSGIDRSRNMIAFHLK